MSRFLTRSLPRSLPNIVVYSAVTLLTASCATTSTQQYDTYAQPEGDTVFSADHDTTVSELLFDPMEEHALIDMLGDPSPLEASTAAAESDSGLSKEPAEESAADTPSLSSFLEASAAPAAAATEASEPPLNDQLTAINTLTAEAPPQAAPVRRQREPRFDVTAADTPARTFFMSLVHGTDVNMVIHPEVDGVITINLQNVTLSEALEAVRDAYGYDFTRKPYGYQVLPKSLQSRVFPIDYLNISRLGQSSTTVSSGQVSSSGSTTETSSTGESTSSNSETVLSSQIQTSSDNSFWDKLQLTLSGIVGGGDGRRVMVDPISSIAIVKALPSELQEVQQYIDSAQVSLRQQVLIEAKIMEVELQDGYTQGIQWNTLLGADFDDAEGRTDGRVAGRLNGIDVDTTSGQNNSLIGGVFSLGARLTDFTAILSLLEQQGDVSVLSSPRVATLNNQKAVIKVGADEFFVTNIASTETTSVTGTSDTPEITLTPFFSGIALDVTPQIARDGQVTLHIHPSISDVTERVKTVSLGDEIYTLPLAYSTIRETDSVIRAKDGQIVVIGGLMQDVIREETSGIPLLRHIPWIGDILFSQKSRIKSKSELVILLKPHIVTVASSRLEQEAIEQRFENYFPDMDSSPIIRPTRGFVNDAAATNP